MGNKSESQKIYLKTIFELEQTLEKVRSVDIAAALGYTKPSVSNMMKKLRLKGLVSDKESDGILLTEKGKEEVAKFSGRLEVIADFLMKLGAEHESARENAVRIERVLSEDIYQLINSNT